MDLLFIYEYTYTNTYIYNQQKRYTNICVYTCKKYIWYVYITIHYIHDVIYTHTSCSEGVMNDTQTTESSEIRDIYSHVSDNVSGLRILLIIKLE